MQLLVQQAGASLSVIPTGLGPIVSLSMGPESAPSSVADAPIYETPEDSDNVLIDRDGALAQIPYAGVVSAAAAGAAAAAVADVASALATFTAEIAAVTETADAAFPASSAGAMAGLGVGTGLAVAGGNANVVYGAAAGTAAQGNDSRITGAVQASALAALLATTAIPASGMTPFAIDAENVVGSWGTCIPLQWFENQVLGNITASNAASIANYAQLGGGTLTAQNTAGYFMSAATLVAPGAVNMSFILQQALNYIAVLNTTAIALGSGATYTLDISAAGEYICNTQILLPLTGNFNVKQDQNAHFKFTTSGTKGNACFSDGATTALPRPSNVRWQGGKFGKVGDHYYTDPSTGVGTLNGDPYLITLTPSPIPAWSSGQKVAAQQHLMANGLPYVYTSPGITGSVAPIGCGEVELGTGIVDGAATCNFASRPNVGGYLAAPLYIGTATTPGASNASSYSGDIWYFWIDNFTSIEQEVLHWCNPGQAWKIAGENMFFVRPKMHCCNGTSGAGGFHFRFGSGVCIGGKGCSGDDLWIDVMETSPYTNGSGYGGGANLPTKGMRFIGCEGASLQGRFLTMGLDVPNSSQVYSAALETSQGSPGAVMQFAPAALHAAGDLSSVTVGAGLFAKGYWPGAPNFLFVETITGNNASGWTVTATGNSLAAIPEGTTIRFLMGVPLGSLTAGARARAAHCVGYSAGGYGTELHQSDSEALGQYAYDHCDIDCSGQGFNVICAGQGSASSMIPFGAASNAWWITQARTVPVTATLNVWLWDYEGNNLLEESSGQCYVLSTSGSVGAGDFSIVIADNNGPFTPSAAIPAGAPVFFSLNANASAGLHVVGGAYGGGDIASNHSEWFGAFRSPLQSSGTVRRFSDRDSKFFAPQTPGMPANLGGVLFGKLDGTMMWGSGAPGDQVLLVGAAVGTDELGETLAGACSNLTIEDVQLCNGANGTYACDVQYSNGVNVQRVKIIPGDASGAQAANGIRFYNGSTKCNADFNDCSRLAGTGINTASGNNVGFGNLAGTTPITPVMPASFIAAVNAAIASQGTV